MVDIARLILAALSLTLAVIGYFLARGSTLEEWPPLLGIAILFLLFQIAMETLLAMVRRFKSPSPRERLRRTVKDGKAFAREARRLLKRHGYKLDGKVRLQIAEGEEALRQAIATKQEDPIHHQMRKLDEKIERHLSFGRKSTFREYAESIGVAVFVALLLRAFVVEAFKIPSGSMIPTLKIGDHIFVNKYLYGLRLPFTHLKFLDSREPKRGEVVVFIYPVEEDKDFIKRVVGVPGDKVELRSDILYINDQPMAKKFVQELVYEDYDEASSQWFTRKCHLFLETIASSDGSQEEYYTINEISPHKTSYGPFFVQPGHVFVLGDNRNNSHDSRFWGQVPFDHVKGRALVVWWSSGGAEGVRWKRFGKVIH